LLEHFSLDRIADDFGPFTEKASNQSGHLLFQLCADAKLILQNNFAKVVNAAGQILNPSSGALQFVGGTNVKHKETIEDRDDGVWRTLFDEKFSVTRLR